MAVLTRPAVPTHRPPQRPLYKRLDWGAAGWAGIIGALVFIALEIGPLFFGRDPWQPVRMIAAIVLSFLPSPHPSPGTIALAALAVHLPLSLIYARILALLTYNRGEATSLLIGALFGLGLYFLNYYVFTSLFPWFTGARSLHTIIDHVVFGVVTVGVYKLFQGRLGDV